MQHICCRKGIWSPRGGDLVPQTLPTAEPSILARGIEEKMTCANGGVFRDQIPRVRGPNSLISHPSRKRSWKQSPKFLRNHYFYSGFVLFRAFFREVPKTRKKQLAESATIRGRFRGGDFCTNSPFLFLSNFYLAPLAHSHLRTVLKPLLYSSYIYICCRVKTWSKIWGFLSQNLVQGCVKTWSKIFFACFSPIL